MSSAPPPAAAAIAADARWLAQALDPAAMLVRLIAMTPDDYRGAAFLDDRMLAQSRQAHTLPWATVAAAFGPAARRDARWIFHIGHVGSTLVARLLGELPDVLAVREPRLLRDLTTAPQVQRLTMAAAVQALYARTFLPGQVALLKATSFVSEIAAELVPAEGRALLLTASPSAYIEGILAGENSVRELQAMAASRRARLAARVPALPPPASLADLAAAAWACETTALEAAAEAIGNVLWADFDRLLADLDGGMVRIADGLALGAPPERVREINRGPLLGRYSKDPTYDYSPALRRDLLAEARAMHGAEIDRAITLLHKAAAGSPLLERALHRATREG